MTPFLWIPSTFVARQSAITSFPTACRLIPCSWMTPPSPRTRLARRQTAAAGAVAGPEVAEAVVVVVAVAAVSKFLSSFFLSESTDRRFVSLRNSVLLFFYLHDHGNPHLLYPGAFFRLGRVIEKAIPQFFFSLFDSLGLYRPHSS